METVPDREPKDRPPKGRPAATSGENTTFNDSRQDDYRTDTSKLPEVSELNNSDVKIDLAESNYFYEADMEMEGFRADEITTEIVAEQFVIKAKDFSASIPLPSEVDLSNIETSYDGRIFSVRMHKRK